MKLRLALCIILVMLVSGIAVKAQEDPETPEEWATLYWETGLAMIQRQDYSEAATFLTGCLGHTPADRSCYWLMLLAVSPEGMRRDIEVFVEGTDPRALLHEWEESFTLHDLPMTAGQSEKFWEWFSFGYGNLLMWSRDGVDHSAQIAAEHFFGAQPYYTDEYIPIVAYAQALAALYAQEPDGGLEAMESEALPEVVALNIAMERAAQSLHTAGCNPFPMGLLLEVLAEAAAQEARLNIEFDTLGADVRNSYFAEYPDSRYNECAAEYGDPYTWLLPAE